MTQTVDDLRNEIRSAVGRFTRVESTAFTKETLAAVRDAVGYEIPDGTRPSKAEMRAGILWRIGELETDDPAAVSSAFRKAELAAVAEAVGAAE